MDTLGVGFLLTAGLCMEHLLCPRDHGLCVHHVTSYAQYPVTPGEDTETQVTPLVYQVRYGQAVEFTPRHFGHPIRGD